MPDRNPQKIYPYCKSTVDGSCNAINLDSWANFQERDADKAIKEGKIKKGEELQEAAQEIRSSIKYCSVCPLRVK